MRLWDPSGFVGFKHLALEYDWEAVQVSKCVGDWVARMDIHNIVRLELRRICLPIDHILAAAALTKLSLNSVSYTAADFRCIISLSSRLLTFILRMKVPPVPLPHYDVSLGPVVSTNCMRILGGCGGSFLGKILNVLF